MLAISSVGSLDADVGVGSVVCPDDFIALTATVTTFEDPRGHMPAGFDAEWRRRVLGAWEASGAGPLRDGGVYWQTSGPRFETPAEIRLLAAHADLVGMTIASECVVACELGLAYAAVCVVDILATASPPPPLPRGARARPRAQRLAPARRPRRRPPGAGPVSDCSIFPTTVWTMQQSTVRR